MTYVPCAISALISSCTLPQFTRAPVRTTAHARACLNTKCEHGSRAMGGPAGAAAVKNEGYLGRRRPASGLGSPTPCFHPAHAACAAGIAETAAVADATAPRGPLLGRWT